MLRPRDIVAPLAGRRARDLAIAPVLAMSMAVVSSCGGPGSPATGATSAAETGSAIGDRDGVEDAASIGLRFLTIPANLE